MAEVFVDSVFPPGVREVLLHLSWWISGEVIQQSSAKVQKVQKAEKNVCHRAFEIFLHLPHSDQSLTWCMETRFPNLQVLTIERFTATLSGPAEAGSGSWYSEVKHFNSPGRIKKRDPNKHCGPDKQNWIKWILNQSQSVEILYESDSHFCVRKTWNNRNFWQLKCSYF